MAVFLLLYFIKKNNLIVHVGACDSIKSPFSVFAEKITLSIVFDHAFVSVCFIIHSENLKLSAGCKPP